MMNKRRINIFSRSYAEFFAELRGEYVCYLRTSAFPLRNSARNILAIIFSFLFITCKKENRCDCLKRTGNIVRQERFLPHVQHFNFGKGKLNCFITHDPVYKIEIEAGDNLIDLIKTEVRNDTLFFTNNNTCNFTRSYKPQITVYISTPDLKSIIQNGVGRIESTNTITSNAIFVETWSSGDIKLDIDCDYFFTHAHKSTAIYASGRTREHVSHMWHNSTFYGENLATDITSLYNNTTGNFNCRVSNSLLVFIRLSGEVIYEGNPVVDLYELGGTGKVRKR